MNLAVRITPPVRVSSRTSTVVRELRTSTLRPARVASMTYSRAEPLPASTRTSTKSPLDIPLYVFPIRALSERGAAASEPPQRGAAERGRRLLPGLRPVGERHADRLRRRHRARPDDADRRAAGRPGGPPGQAVRRARGTPPGEGAGRGGDRPPAGLRHQRRQALPLDTPRQAPPARKAECRPGPCLPPLAGGGDHGGAAADHGPPGRDRRPVCDGTCFPRHKATGRGACLSFWFPGGLHRPPYLHSLADSE